MRAEQDLGIGPKMYVNESPCKASLCLEKLLYVSISFLL